MQLNPYLNFNGQCKEAFTFYQQVLGGSIEAMMPHKGSPMENQTPADWQDKILHARLVVDGMELMGSDSPPEYYKEPQGLYISLGMNDPSEAERIFSALAENGKVQMPIQQTFWAIRFGMLVDRFGIPWIINCDQAS